MAVKLYRLRKTAKPFAVEGMEFDRDLGQAALPPALDSL